MTTPDTEDEKTRLLRRRGPAERDAYLVAHRPQLEALVGAEMVDVFMAEMGAQNPSAERFDRDPAALAWARAKIQTEVDRLAAIADQHEAGSIDANGWRFAARTMERRLVHCPYRPAVFAEPTPAEETTSA